MRSISLYTIFAMSLFPAILAAPLGVAFPRRKSNPVTDANMATVQQTAGSAHNQILNMQTVVNDPNNPRYAPYIAAAFGADRSLDISHVQSVVDAMAGGDMMVVPEEMSYADPSQSAATNWRKKKGTWEPTSVEFGTNFYHPATTPEGRTATMIHEASHYFGKTGDNVSPPHPVTGDKHLLPENNDERTGENGYTSSIEPPKTIADVDADMKFTDVRDTVKNMHYNAESYAVLASLCSQPGVIRRDVRMFRRALAMADEDEFHFLMRRSAASCKLPPNYFKDKAAAKAKAKAAASNAAPSSPAPAPGAQKPLSQPVANKPVANKPVAIANNPVANRPIATKPVANSPVANHLVANNPVANRPVANKPVARPLENTPSTKPASKPVLAARPLRRH